ncbi:MAG: sigma-54 dependent transcriptional regulator [Desulfobaccales bacterium]|jgi:DNA-binding NtrC family response regulator
MGKKDAPLVSGLASSPGPAPPELSGIITKDSAFRLILARLPAWAQSDLPIMLTGEPGTGKELVARAIFALNPQRRPCQLINCAALTESLAGSELFGHLRGAFTDARSPRLGKFRQAHGGTLFLDEIGELPLSVQSKLLRAVEQGEIEPVGGDMAVKVDVRLVAATNQDLRERIARGYFRQDLYDRLAVLEIHLPPLRERGEDIVLLARHFAPEAARRHGCTGPLEFTAAAWRRLEAHSWPGNVRELKNAVTRAVLLHRGWRICQEDIQLASGAAPGEPGRGGGTGVRAAVRPSRRRLEELLDETRGNISVLSRRLGVCTKTMDRWIRSSNIDLMNLRRGTPFSVLRLTDTMAGTDG